MSYAVRVTDNFHHVDTSEEYSAGEFATWDEAVERCRKIVDDSLRDLHEPGMTAEKLFQHYVTFGDGPYVVPSSGARRFIAWDYAKARCPEICAGGGGGGDRKP